VSNVKNERFVRDNKRKREDCYILELHIRLLLNLLLANTEE